MRRYTHRPTTWIALTPDGGTAIAESPGPCQYRVFVKQLKELGYMPDDVILTHRQAAERDFITAVTRWDGS